MIVGMISCELHISGVLRRLSRSWRGARTETTITLRWETGGFRSVWGISRITFFTRTVTTPWISITRIRTNSTGLQLRLPMSNSRNLSLLKIVEGCISKFKFSKLSFHFYLVFSQARETYHNNIFPHLKIRKFISL